MKRKLKDGIIAIQDGKGGVYDYAAFFLAELSQLKFKPKVITGQSVPEIIIDGHKVISFASNNVLGLGVDSSVLEKSAKFLKTYGTTCGGSRLVSGNLTIQEELEHKLAEFMNKESCQLFMTGYMANEGVLLALSQRISLLRSRKLDERVVILSDRENHISIVNGCWLAKQVNNADVRFYRHRNMVHLEKLLEKYKDYERKLIVTEGVYSMLGDIAPLDDIVKVAKKHGAFIILDDAHSIGIFGKAGRGTSEKFNITADIDLIIGTFSKAFGGVGGFVVSNKQIVDFLKVQCSTYIFSSALPPSVVGGIEEALLKISNGSHLRKKLWKNVAYVRKMLKKIGYNLLSSHSHILPICIGEESLASTISRDLLEKGIFLPEIRWPAVSKGKSIMRCMVTALHEQKHLDKLIQSLKEIYETRMAPK